MGDADFFIVDRVIKENRKILRQPIGEQRLTRFLELGADGAGR